MTRPGHRPRSGQGTRSPVLRTVAQFGHIGDRHVGDGGFVVLSEAELRAWTGLERTAVARRRRCQATEGSGV
jgi:hypothetical protein